MTPEEFKAHRERAGLSLEALARLADCSTVYVGLIAKGYHADGEKYDRVLAILESAPDAPPRPPRPVPRQKRSQVHARAENRRKRIDAMRAAIKAIDDERPDLARVLLRKAL